MKHAILTPKSPNLLMKLNIALPSLLGTLQEARNLNNSPKNGASSKQQAALTHCKQQQTEGHSKQQAIMPATSCKDRSPTPHPCRSDNTAHSSMERGREDTRQSGQPTARSCRNRSPTPHPCEHGNTCVRTSSKSTNKSLWMDNSFQIDTILVHQNSPQSTEHSSLQDYFRCIPGPSTHNHVKPSHIPVPSKLLFQNTTRNNKDKPQKCYKGVSCITIPQCRKKHIIKPPRRTVLATLQHHWIPQQKVCATFQDHYMTLP